MTTKNLLYNTRVYLIGGMQYVNGRGWRETIKSELSDRNITFFDPYCKPMLDDVPEDENARSELLNWMETEQYDKAAARMSKIRGVDLRMCDISDFFIVNIKPEVASWGSADEINTIVRQKKPVFLSIDHPKGKKATPLWLMATIPHKFIYNNINEAIEMIKKIDDGTVKMDSDRWKLLRPEFR